MNKIAIALFLVSIAVGQTKPAHPPHAAKPETPHLNVVKEYVRELIEAEDLKTNGEKELSEAKTLNERFSAGIYYSKSTQLELRSEIRMLQSMHLKDPFDTLIPSLVAFYGDQIKLHQQLIDISDKFLAGPKEGVDYQALGAKVPEIRAELDDSRKSVFQVAALVFMTLIDQKPDSQNHSPCPTDTWRPSYLSTTRSSFVVLHPGSRATHPATGSRRILGRYVPPRAAEAACAAALHHELGPPARSAGSPDPRPIEVMSSCCKVSTKPWATRHSTPRAECDVPSEISR